MVRVVTLSRKARSCEISTLEPLYRLDVEVVCRLVEQKDRRPAQQYLRKLYSHSPAARELARRPVEILAFEPESQQGLFDVGIAGLASQDVVTVVAVVEPVHQTFVFIAVVVGAFGQLCGYVFDLGLETQYLVEGLCCLVEQGGCVGHLHLLRQVSDRTVAGHRYGSRRRLLLACYDAQERGLAGTVFPHQTDAVLGVDHEGYVVKKRPAAKTDGEVVDSYHRVLSGI